MCGRNDSKVSVAILGPPGVTIVSTVVNLIETKLGPIKNHEWLSMYLKGFLMKFEGFGWF